LEQFTRQAIATDCDSVSGPCDLAANIEFPITVAELLSESHGFSRKSTRTSLQVFWILQKAWQDDSHGEYIGEDSRTLSASPTKPETTTPKSTKKGSLLKTAINSPVEFKKPLTLQSDAFTKDKRTVTDIVAAARAEAAARVAARRQLTAGELDEVDDTNIKHEVLPSTSESRKRSYSKVTRGAFSEPHNNPTIIISSDGEDSISSDDALLDRKDFFRDNSKTKQDSYIKEESIDSEHNDGVGWLDGKESLDGEKSHNLQNKARRPEEMKDAKTKAKTESTRTDMRTRSKGKESDVMKDSETEPDGVHSLEAALAKSKTRTGGQQSRRKPIIKGRKK
jgi:DNA-binding protein YbaB